MVYAGIVFSKLGLKLVSVAQRKELRGPEVILNRLRILRQVLI